MRYTDVMVDLETLGRTPGCAIIQIAAVPFNINTGEISKNTFKMSINLDHQMKSGKHFTYSKETYKWWMKENPKLFKELCNSKITYNIAGSEFQKWFRKLYQNQNIRMWGNSARFDLGILEGWYQNCLSREFQPFWNTWKERDVRTLAALDDKVKKSTEFVGTRHNAIDDCKHQIKYCRAIVKKYKLKIE